MTPAHKTSTTHDSSEWTLRRSWSFGFVLSIQTALWMECVCVRVMVRALCWRDTCCTHTHTGIKRAGGVFACGSVGCGWTGFFCYQTCVYRRSPSNTGHTISHSHTHTHTCLRPQYRNVWWCRAQILQFTICWQWINAYFHLH